MTAAQGSAARDEPGLPPMRDVHAADFPYLMSGDTDEQIEAKMRHAPARAAHPAETRVPDRPEEQQ